MFVAVDSGGTFTDFVCFDSEQKQVRYTKSLTTHQDPITGILECMHKTGTDPAVVSMFKHGTTHVINILLERNGPVIALVTTAGFRDVLEFGRGNRTEAANLFFKRDEHLIPRENRFEVEERIGGDGKVIKSPDLKEIDHLAEKILKSGAQGVAVSFINSYLNDTHEIMVAERLSALLPDLFITTGARLSREWYEYERTTTAAANAYCGPRVGSYINRLNQRLHEDGFCGQFFMMGSSGGVLAPLQAASSPILLVESGPVGGCIGTAVLSKALGISNMIAFDMGGTTAKCALIRNGEFDVETKYYVGGYGKGIPIKAPVVDIVEVGAGGGSIAWIDAQNRIHVGPRSAGSMPGPVAYGRGGTQPTVTDANLVLGRLNAANFQGGEMSLDTEAACTAISSQIATAFGYGGNHRTERAALGILELAAVKMGEAIKRVTVERGMDPRDFTLCAFGGGGPLHSVELARELAIPEVMIPPEAGNFSAFGMLMADLRYEETRTFLCQTSDQAIIEADDIFNEIRIHLEQNLHQEISDIPLIFSKFAEMRYIGQHHTVHIPMDKITSGTALHEVFCQIYRERFGKSIDWVGSEIVSLHGILQGDIIKPAIDQTLQQLAQEPQPPKARLVWYPGHDQPLMADVYARSSLKTGFSASGPAVIEEYGSTTIIGPTDSFKIGLLSEIRIQVGQGKLS